MDIATALHSALAEKVGRRSYDLWFGPQTRLELRDGSVAVYAPNNFFLDWIRSQFRRSIEIACEETFRRPMALEFLLDPVSTPTPGDGAGKAGATVGLPNRACPTAGQASSGTHMPRDPVSPTDSAPPTEATDPAPGGSARPRRTFHNLESFVVGPSNQLAYAGAEQIVRRPGEISPLVIYGSTGFGKTHLLEGIWTAARQARRAAPPFTFPPSSSPADFCRRCEEGEGCPASAASTATWTCC